MTKILIKNMMRWAKLSLFLFLLFFCFQSSFAQDHERDPFKVKFDDQVLKVHPGEIFPFTVQFKVPKGHFLYDEKTSVLFERTADLETLKTERPSAELHFDPFSKKNTGVFFTDFAIQAFFRVPANASLGRRTLEGTLRYQGCSDDFCYRPIKKTFLLPVEVVDPGQVISPLTKTPPERKKPSIWDWVYETNPEKLLNQGKVFLLGLALLGGILTSFTPCVLPIVPLTLAFIGVKHRRRGNLLRALMLVGGMVTMYALLGFLAASFGLKLGFLFQSRYFLGFTALFFLIFALGLFEVIPFHLPPRWHHRLVQMGGEGPWGAYLAGMTIGLIASPCVGPLIAPLLLIAAREQDRLFGFILLFHYGVGMGLIFLVLASAYAELVGKIRSGKWSHFLKKAMGILMLAPAFYYGFVFARPYLEPAKNGLWIYQFEQGLETAQQLDKPILLDFYADWCLPCLELDKKTFSSAEVREKAKDFVMLKIDCSTDTENCQKATARYQVIGWPTVLFLDPEGSPIEDVKLVGGFADKVQMLKLMDQALMKTERDGR